MKTNELKKGIRIQMKNGWYGTVMDNARGNIRLCEVEGTYTEIGSVYAHDIAKASIDGNWIGLEYTPAQLKLQNDLKLMFG